MSVFHQNCLESLQRTQEIFTPTTRIISDINERIGCRAFFAVCSVWFYTPTDFFVPNLTLNNINLNWQRIARKWIYFPISVQFETYQSLVSPGFILGGDRCAPYNFFVGNLILNNFYLNNFLIHSVILAAFSPKLNLLKFHIIWGCYWKVRVSKMLEKAAIIHNSYSIFFLFN